MIAMSQALVIGNGAYAPNLKLACPPNDATEVGRTLGELGFQVTLGINLSFETTLAQIEKFVALVNEPTTTVSLLYYSGHGLQIDDQNYMVPIDFDQFAEQKIAQLVSVQSIVEKMTSKTAVRIVLLDACRNNTDARVFVGGKGIKVGKEILIDNQPIPATGLASMQAATNTFIAFAAAPGQVAYDGSPGDLLSPFSASFVRYLDAVDLPISNLTSRIRQDVLNHTGGNQRTWDQSSLMAPFYFNPGSLLLFTGNLMALVGLFLSLIPYSLILAWPNRTWPWLMIASALPMISLGILLFGAQTVYSRLRGRFEGDSNAPHTIVEHLRTAAQKGLLGGYLGSSAASLLLSLLYYRGWDRPTEPFGALLLEITIATALTACLLGALGLFFARASIGWSGFYVTDDRSPRRMVIGATCGGALAGVIAAPLITMYFGKIHDRPEMTPGLLLPGSILGASIIIFSIVNFDFERLSARRVRTSAGAAVAALALGGVAACIVFGPLYMFGVVDAVKLYLEINANNLLGLASGGAVYGLPVGVVLGVVIGSAIVLTEKWSRKPVLE
ncbi:caspase family protein [Mesorhizobium sp. B263B2A]|uniref:caspase family protein n=1 Tax=Mesorhizobium sp. B263B2A TaxID=2876669 RepID=UPI001CD081AA|nr:caspase family protein [Mesorhizobium sp. B263B2A]MCA0029472.1 caspase family protein [Mesorhizobium sp. B263B2A]